MRPRAWSSARTISYSTEPMEASQKASMGRMENGSSICRPSSSMPSRKKVMPMHTGAVSK